MPYKIQLCGIYRIINHVTGDCYVGQSRNLYKRIAEHFRLLRKNQHPNPHLQGGFNTHGQLNFSGDIEVICEDARDLDTLEEAFLTGDAVFDESHLYNISSTAHAPMSGRAHSEEVRKRIRLGRRAATFDYSSAAYKKTLSEAQRARFLRDPKFVERLRFILDNSDMSYAARGRHVGINTSTVRKLALTHANLKGTI